jgi:hypothetical protein
MNKLLLSTLILSRTLSPIATLQMVPRMCAMIGCAGIIWSEHKIQTLDQKINSFHRLKKKPSISRKVKAQKQMYTWIQRASTILFAGGIFFSCIPSTSSSEEYIRNAFEKDRECPVCFDETKGFDQFTISSRQCKHLICIDCKHQWKQKNPTCPMCRTPFD